MEFFSLNYLVLPQITLLMFFTPGFVKHLLEFKTLHLHLTYMFNGNPNNNYIKNEMLPVDDSDWISDFSITNLDLIHFNYKELSRKTAKENSKCLEFNSRS